MKVICSFCSEVISEGKTPEDPVSHGVCRPCYEKILSKYRLNARKYLEMLDAPVFLVDAEANVLAANSQALSLRETRVDYVENSPCGDLLGCINASHPPGCGKTEFCPDCTIRNSVTGTYSTGVPVEGLPAVIKRSCNGKIEEVRVLVSTRKEGDVVLLRLKPVASA